MKKLSIMSMKAKIDRIAFAMAASFQKLPIIIDNIPYYIKLVKLGKAKVK